jgi:hypothetical protein
MRTIPELKEGTHRAKATGTLPNGKPVVVNSDGTVSVVEGVAEGAGTPVVFEAGTTNFVSTVFDSNSNKIVIAYRDSSNSNYGTAIVGSVSGTSISFGTPSVFRSNNAQHIAATFDSNSNKVVIGFQDVASSFRGTAIVGTVSGTSISFGSFVVFDTSAAEQIAATFDTSNSKVIMCWQRGGSDGVAVVGTVSGSSISFGSSVTFSSGTAFYISATFDSNSNKTVIAYGGPSNYATAIIGTVSGTSISFGTPVVFHSVEPNYTSATFDSVNNKVVVAYRNNNASARGTAIVGTVSGTSISFGSSVQFNTDVTNYTSAVFDSSSGKVVISYSDYNNSQYGTVITGTVSGTSISFDDPSVFESAAVDNIGSAFDSNSNKVVIGFQDQLNSSYGTAAVFAVGSTNLTSENYIGMSQGGSVANGSSATVDIIGSLSTNQSGLTAGQSYYVQTDGTLGTTPADPSVFAGTAISATSLVVKT